MSIAVDRDRYCFNEDLRQYLSIEVADQTMGLVIGAWSDVMSGVGDAQGIIRILVDHRDRLTNLSGIFFGQISSWESDIAYISLADMSPLLAAFPTLEMLRVRGGSELALTHARHANLRGLALETGGLDVAVLRSICTGDFPKLEHLELWFGTPGYGCTCTLEDLQPLLSGRLFPKLRYLGLRNCEFTDDIAGVLANSPVMQRIVMLDLSLGTLSDIGAKALVSIGKETALTELRIGDHHFLTPKMVKMLKKSPFEVHIGEGFGPDLGRFVSVSE